MSTTAILTIKRFDTAKQRLGNAHLSRRLAKAMMTDVLATLGRCDAVDSVLIVSGEPETRDLGDVIDDPDEGHNPAATRGIAAALERGATRVLLCAGDCPLTDPLELEALLDTAWGERVVVIADRHGTGTNGLILCPPGAIEPAFGEGSCSRHANLARDAGVDCTVATGTSLALDIDTPDDLEELLRSVDEGLAPVTHAALRAEGLL